MLFIGPACPVSDVQQLNNERGILERYSENYNYEVSSKTSTYFFFWSELQSLVEYFDTLQNERLTVRLNLTRKKSTPRKCLWTRAKKKWPNNSRVNVSVEGAGRGCHQGNKTDKLTSQVNPAKNLSPSHWSYKAVQWKQSPSTTPSLSRSVSCACNTTRLSNPLRNMAQRYSPTFVQENAI